MGILNDIFGTGNENEKEVDDETRKELVLTMQSFFSAKKSLILTKTWYKQVG